MGLPFVSVNIDSSAEWTLFHHCLYRHCTSLSAKHSCVGKWANTRGNSIIYISFMLQIITSFTCQMLK